MGLETAFLLASAAQVGTQVFGGFAANSAAKAEAAAQEQQANLAREEGLAEADRIASTRRDFLKRQKLAFLKSGVSLEGSPLLVLETTRAESQKEVDAITNRSLAQQKLGLQRAAITRGSGRAALTQGFGQAAGTITNSLITGKTAGIF